MKKDTLIPVLSRFGLVATTIIWGFAFVVVKNSLDYITPMYILALRFSIAGVLLGLIYFKKLKKINKKTFIQGVWIGVFLFLAYVLQTVGLVYTTAGKNAFLTTIYVMIVPFIHWIISKKRPDSYSLAAAVIAMIGVGLISLNSDFSVNIGDFLTLLCGFAFAMQIVLINRYTEQSDPILLTVLQLLTAAVLSWIIAPITEGGFPIQGLRWETVTAVMYLGIFSTLIGFLLQTVCQKYLPPTTASLLLSFESVFGVLFSVLFLAEQISLKTGVGCLLMFFAVILSETKLSFRKKATLTI